jgi:hypothetical protein
MAGGGSACSLTTVQWGTTETSGNTELLRIPFSRSSQNPVKRKSNFGVGRLAEVQLPKALRRHALHTLS